VRLSSTILLLLALTASAVVIVTPFSASRSEAQLAGDANCDGIVNPIDAAIILQLDAGIVGSLACPEKADANADGALNSLDALLILQHSAGIIHSLPPSSVPTPTPTGTATLTPSFTHTPTSTVTQTPTPTATQTPAPMVTPTLTASVTLMGTATSTATPSVTRTPTVTLTPTATPTATPEPLLRSPSAYWIECRLAVCNVLYPQIECTSTGPLGSIARFYSVCTAPTWSMACAPGAESFLVCVNGQDGQFTCNLSFPDNALTTLDCNGSVWQGSCTVGLLSETQQAPISCSRTDSGGTELLDCVWTVVSEDCNWQKAMSFSCVSQFANYDVLLTCNH
jgi:hypothetical protein